MPTRGVSVLGIRHGLTIPGWQLAMIPPQAKLSAMQQNSYHRRETEKLQVDGYKPVKQQQVPAGCRRDPGHPCHGPEKKSKGARRSGSDMRRMFHRCIASGDDTRRSAGQGAVGSKWPVSEQRLKEGSAKSAVIRASRHKQRRRKYG